MLRAQTGFTDKRANVAGNDATPCSITVEHDDGTHTWTMKYKRSNMEQTIMFKMPKQAKFPGNVIKVINVPSRSTPQSRMEIARDSTGRSLLFSDKNMKKGTIRMEIKFSEDFTEVTRVVTLRGKEISCVEKFIRSECDDV